MKTFRVLQVFCGSGGKGLGAKRALARVGNVEGSFVTIGGIDSDPLACRDFEMLVGAPTLCVDVELLEPAQLLEFAGPDAPDAVMMSPPCKGFSGLLSAKRAAEEKYQRMNQLMLRALFLCVATWPRPPKLIFIENVPRIASRGAEIVRQAFAIGAAHGYAMTQGTHDCGELGGLAQHRRRWFSLWRHREQVPEVVYQPAKRRVRACGEVIGPLPIPGDVETGGPMHAVPKLSWRNWLRLALIPAGGDWRDLPGTLVDGQKRREKFRRSPVRAWDTPAETVTGPGGSASAAVADPRVALACEPRSGAYGVLGFDQPADTITGAHGVDNGRAAIADPRFGNVDRVTAWEQPVGTITHSPAPSSGAGAIADPRIVEQLKLADNPTRHRNKYTVGSFDAPVPTVIGASRPGSGAPAIADPRWGGALGVNSWDQAATTVTGESLPSNGQNAVADPRIPAGEAYRGVLGVSDWSEPAGTVTGNGRPGSGRFAVADPRFADGKKKNWQQVAGVTPWTEPAPTVTSGAKLHAGAFQVADPRCAAAGRYRVLTLAEALELDLPPDRPPPFIPIIIAEDGTWHRPLTTLELAVLQSLPAVFEGRPLVLAGSGHTRWRAAIGNLVPPDAAESMAEQLLIALLVAAIGSFALSSNEVWVAPEARVA